MSSKRYQHGELEFKDPSEFIVHPIREKFFVAPDEKPEHERLAIEDAFSRMPYPVIPVLYDWVEIDGKSLPGIIDGVLRVQKAIEYGIENIPAVRIHVDEDNWQEAIVANQNYHQSAYEQGKIAAGIWEEISVGQGHRSDLREMSEEEADKNIAEFLGKSSTSKITKSWETRVRIVYQRDKSLLQRVDDELMTLTAAYKTVKVPRKKVRDEYENLDDSPASKVSDETGDEDENNFYSDRSQIGENNDPEEESYSSEESEDSLDDDTAQDELIPVEVLAFDYEPGDECIIIQCPCCDKRVKIMLPA